MKDNIRCTIIIPSLNPNNKLLELVNNLLESGFKDIIVVNDGSAPEYDAIYNVLPKQVKLLKHDINKGKGAAIKTALKELKNTDAFITVDSDGQHSVEDVFKIKEALTKYDVVLGTRNFKLKNVPLRSRFGNKISSIAFKMETGINLKDTQTGLRGINIKHKDLALKTEGNRYEYEMNFLTNLAKNKIKIHTVSIKTIYEDNNKGSHFNVIRDSILIHKWIIWLILIVIVLLILLKYISK